MFYKVLNAVLKAFHLSILVAKAARRKCSGKDVLKICSKFTGEHPCFPTLLKSHFGMGVFPMNTSGGLHTFFYKQRFFQLSLSVA